MMKNKFLVIFGFLLMIGLVSASTQTYELNVDVDYGTSNDSLVLSVDSLDEDSLGYVLNPINFTVGTTYSNSVCSLTIVGPTSYSNNNLNDYSVDLMLSSGSYEWNVTCSDEYGNLSDTIIRTFEVEDVSLSFGGIENDKFYFNGSTVNGNVGFTKDIQFLLNGEEVTPSSFDENTGYFELTLDEPGDYVLSASTNYFPDVPNPDGVNIHVGYISAMFNETPIAVDKRTDVDVYMNLGGYSGIYYYNLSVGNSNDGYSSIKDGAWSGDYSLSERFESNKTGTYYIKFNVTIDEEVYEIDGENSLVVSTSAALDDEDPVITMVYPEWEQIITDSEIEFTYKIEDNVDLKLCKLKIYNATQNNAGVYETDKLVFPLSSSDVDLAEENPTGTSDEIDLKLVDFDEGGYIWEVKCEDGAGNEDYDYNYFYVDLTGNYSVTSNYAEYARQTEVQELIDKINLFLESEDDFGINEERAVELLGIDTDMSLYKKKLLQIDQDLKYNLRFMTTDKYEERVKEIDEEIDRIRESIVLNISVEDTYEYSKNNPSISMDNFLSDYFDATGHSISGNSLRRLAKSNEELQDRLSSRVEAIKLGIEYVDSNKELVVVNKKLDFDSGVYEMLLEFVPEEISEDVTFVSGVESVGSGIWEINIEGLENDELTYYFYDDLSLQKIEKTESILFSENMGDGSFITGFVIGIGDPFGLGILPILVGALFMGYVGLVIFGKARMEVWKKEPNVVRILELIKSAKLLLKENNVGDARAKYAKMGETYKVLPNNTKHFFFNEIKMIRLAIDKKDVINLIKEYEQAKNAGRMTDASELHAKISAVYKKLPKKFQEKVYQRLIKNELK